MTTRRCPRPSRPPFMRPSARYPTSRSSSGASTRASRNCCASTSSTSPWPSRSSKPPCSRSSPAIRASAPRPTWRGAHLRRRRKICRQGPWLSASARAASSAHCCWRRWASGRSCWSAASPCGNARATPGACGARACSTPSRTCSSAKAAPAPFQTASSTARSRTRAFSAAR